MCEAGAVLENGRLTYYKDVEDAIAHHEQNMAKKRSA
jgi:capsular polysaccharide transport system ATP-binding protein